MNHRLKPFAALLAVGCLLPALCAPCFAWGTDRVQTTTFSKLRYYPPHDYYINWAPDQTRYDHSYPAKSKKPTLTVNGNDVTFSIPAIDDVPALEIHGTLNDDPAKRRNWWDGTAVLGGFASAWGTVRGAYSIQGFHSDDGDNFTNYGIEEKRWFAWKTNKLGEIYKATVILGGHSGTEKELLSLHLSNDADAATVQEETTHAETNPGEDKGVPIAETVAVSVIGALIGAGLIGASRGGNKKGGKKKKDKNEEDGKKAAPTYKMYVYKGFGDAIQRGASPVKVYARIAQVVEGKEYGCPELTAKIQASGTHLTVKPIGIENGYLCAEVGAALDEASEEAEVIFTLAGEGGAFVRKIIFRLTGNPEIKFPALSEDGENWLMDAGLDTVEMIAGGRGRDRLRFVFQDAATEPTDIRFLDANGFDISYEKDADKPFTYYACIQNRTMLIPKESKVFADPVARTITIEATFSGKLKVRGQFTINLYPEGLFVFIIPDDPEWSHDARLCRRSQGLPEILVQGRMEVVSWKKPRLNGIVDEEIERLFFVPCYAYEKADGRTVVVRESRYFTAGKFQPTDTATGNILAKYRCKIGPIGEKAFCIQPQDILVEGDDAPYHVTLPFSVRHDGRSARADIPIRLLGEPIDTTMVEWETEYKNLQRRIIQFSVPEDIDMWIRLLKERATEPRCSVEDLHLVSRQIVAVYLDYWTKQREADYAEMARADNALTRWEWVKFIGDCAFSYLVNAFAGPLADAIITPAKDIFFYSLGELYACDQHGTKFDWKNLEIVKSLNDAGDNVAANMMVDGVKANIKNAKMIAVYIAGYYVIAVFRNYSAKMAKEGVSDWYGAFKDAFKDLSVNAFKAIAAELFKKWLNSKNFQENISKTLQKYLTKQFKARFKQKYPTYNIDFNSKGITITRTGTGVFKVKAGPNVEKTSAAECVTKFLSELFGRDWGYVHEGVYDWAEHKARTSQLFFNEHGQLVFCFRLWEGEGLRPLYCELVLQKVILYSENPLGFFAYLYEMFFGSLIGAPAITFPKDPPFKRYDKKVWEEEYRHNLPSSRFRGLISQSKSKSKSPPPSDTDDDDSWEV